MTGVRVDADAGLGLEPLAADGHPFITVIMPIRNESGFIHESLGAVLAQDYPSDRYQVLVVDGASDDGTPELCASLAAAAGGPHVEVLNNERRIAPTALNIGLEAARGELVVRVDGHCVIEPDYLTRCVEVSRAVGAECVGGPIATIGMSETASAIAAAQSSKFGVGGVAFRTSTAAALVDTLAFGAYRTEVFDHIGRFDEELVRNQDDELNLRLTQAGGRIWMDPSIRSTYYSRAGMKGLWRQYLGYGRYKVRVMQKRRTVPSIRHLVPASFVVAVVGSVGLSLVLRRRWPALVVLVPYAAGNVAASVQAGSSPTAVKEIATIAAANTTMHVAYGVGFLQGIWAFRRHFR